MEVYMTATTSRRAVLAGVASVPALSLPAIAADHPDAKLLALGRKLEAKNTETAEAFARYSEIDDRWTAMMPTSQKMPEPPQWYQDAMASLTVSQVGSIPEDHPVIVWNRENEKHRRAILDAHEAELTRLSDELGLDDAHAEWEELFEELWEIAREVWEIPARTPAGLALKLRAAELVESTPEPDMAGAEVWDSIVDDIRAMAVQS
jgi:hypothetical protein